MASGIGIADACVEAFNEIKLKHQHKFVVFRVNNDLTQIIVDEKAGPEAQYSDFISKLPRDDCRYAIYDFDYSLPDGGVRNKLIFVVWCPDTAKIKAKMLYAASKDALRKKFVGIGNEFQATDLDEIEYEAVLEKISAGGTK
eukprot:m.45988 g.45988  ORF g.45988 m.45988 type:complete len:142 (-) comp12494_c0_seq1:550-975(-)